LLTLHGPLSPYDTPMLTATLSASHGFLESARTEGIAKKTHTAAANIVTRSFLIAIFLLLSCFISLNIISKTCSDHSLLVLNLAAFIAADQRLTEPHNGSA
jgi:hypothetical protein